jgi:hypothetical protein
MTEIDVQNRIYANHMQGGTLLVVPCSQVFGWEADIVVVTRAFFTHEFEIKLSRQDYLSDSKKEKHDHIQRYIKGERKFNKSGKYGDYQWDVLKPANYFWYACPKGMVDKTEVPEYAGLVLFDERWRLDVVKKAPRLHRDKLDVKDLIQLCRSMTHKFWNQRIKFVED